MKITPQNIQIKELVDGFKDNAENGVVSYGGRLNIRPPFQREFVYDGKQKQAVIDSIFKNFPLNVMYWVKNADGNYELLDGQQRTMSICSYYVKAFSIKLNGITKNYDNLTQEQKEQFLNYELQIYVCEDGTDQERLDWFRIINIAGERLTNQELLNAVYVGSWVTDAKHRFSKTSCVAYQLGRKYMDGKPIRQDYLETVLKWISDNDVESYMSDHQHDENADREWQYFQQVIAWVESLFPKYRSEMKGIAWGNLYNKCKGNDYSATTLEKDVARLMMDRDVQKKKGIYEYVLTGNEHALDLRAFEEDMKCEAYERQKGICKKCGEHFELEEMEADHITPWSKGGKTVADNCQMLCSDCNRRKSNH